MAGTSSVTSCGSQQHRACCSAQPGNNPDQEKKQPTPTNEYEDDDDDDDDQWGDVPDGDMDGRGTRDRPTIGVKGSSDPKHPTKPVKK
ncbi:hypothetical protein K443DRAFT_680938 [Laccaria amethystina LaAM-08-1]|uniref:Unplaced genomic scaffold K443scaffold_139, whole genome shotgun sequence n=1 Tax=Laccaria amethystina LaAM-08-1 TaxID=1095629 RepID=A0A0C9X9U3_9AGAR|nr:hypothetical protein K443DRAFT_680938 [Laccaria amethystina LaAM-08-1]